LSFLIAILLRLFNCENNFKYMKTAFNLSALSLAVLLASSANAQTTVLDELNISGQNAPPTSYTPEPATSAKTPLPTLELPKTITTVNAQTIEDINATRVDDLYEYVGGVSRKENHGGLWDGILIRGFSNGESALINGMVSRGYASIPRDLASVEKVEFIKGPAGSLYGNGEPGGAVMIITKQAHFTPTTILKVQGGSHNYQRTSLDLNNTVNEQAAYRLNLAVEEADSSRTKYVNRNRFVFAPTAIYHFNDDISLEYSGDYIKNNTIMDRGIVMVNGNLKAMDKKTWLGDPADGDLATSNLTHQIMYKQRFNEVWRLDITASNQRKDLFGYATTPDGKPDINGNIDRSIQLRDYHTRNAQLTAELYATFGNNELLLGVEKWRTKLTNLWGGSTNPYFINIYNPTYGGPRPAVDDFSYTWETSNNNAFYVQDTLSLGEKWRFVAGARFDDYQRKNKATKDLANPSISVSFLPTSTFSVYSSLGQAFKPNTGVDFYQNTFKAQKGTSMEIGTKYENSEQTLGAQFAIFDVRKKNVKTTDPLHTNFSVLAGEIKSKGAELDLSGQISKVRLTASLTLLDTTISKDNKHQTGDVLREIEKANAAVLAMYEDTSSIGKYGLGLGTNYVAKRPVNQRSKADYNAGVPIYYLPSYQLWRASAYLNVNKNVRFTLDLENLTDKTYYFGSLTEETIMLGEPFTANFSVNLKF